MLKEYIAKCKIALSLKKSYGGGGKEFDYAALGLPCIRVIKKGGSTGEDLPWVIKVWEDPENIAEAIYRLLSDNEIYQELSNKAIKAITEEYNFYKLSKRLYEGIFGMK
jgi:glycosyltransferase involved in cell wall biosynthesis